MKIDAFLTLEAVLRTGTFAAAAGEMKLTPSAVSMQMKQLELYLGKPLFDRSGLQVRPMPLAGEVVGAMSGGLVQLQRLRKRATVQIEGVVRVGVIESMQPMLLPGTMRLLRDRHPLLELRPQRGRSVGLAAAVKAGELDAALVAQPENGGSTRLTWHPMVRRDLLLVAPPGSQGSLAALFQQYEWIRYDRETVTGALAARFVHAQVPHKRSQLEFDNVAAIVAMVSAGLGISIVQIADPGLMASYPVRVVKLGRSAPALQFSLVVRKTDEDSRPLAALREAMMEVFEGAQRARNTSGL
ncbi:MAG: LysR family transcriptional regulator [Rhizobacter sp.]|nr:LysR family transcriptional regulator [Rhizobacter sp.]